MIQKKKNIIKPYIINKTFKIHNGKTYIIFNVTEDCVGFSFGMFISTRKRGIDSKKK